MPFLIALIFPLFLHDPSGARKSARLIHAKKSNLGTAKAVGWLRWSDRRWLAPRDKLISAPTRCGGAQDRRSYFRDVPIGAFIFR
jgi:hypothetical protein